MAGLLAFCASDKAGYLTGTDILNECGVIASMNERARTRRIGLILVSVSSQWNWPQLRHARRMAPA
jgi:hypothetical protein